jgi:hypothetical protein
MNIRPVAAELFHADLQTDMTKLIVTLRNFTNSPKNIVPEFEFPIVQSVACSVHGLRYRGFFRDASHYAVFQETRFY